MNYIMRQNTYLVSLENAEDPTETQRILVVSECPDDMQKFVDGEMVDEYGNPVILDPPLAIENPRVVEVRVVHMPVIA